MSLKTLEKAIITFETKIQRKELRSSFDLAIQTLSILSLVVSCSRSTQEIEQDLIKTSARLKKSAPHDVIINNCCIRVLDSLNEEMNKTISTFEPHDVRRSHSVSLLELFTQPIAPIRSNSFDEESSFRRALIRIIKDYMDEIPQFYAEIAKKAPEFIHNGDVILTIGQSQSTYAFFKRAKEKHRKFSVMIPEHAPINDGVIMAQKLRQLGIEVLVIPDAAVYAVMPRVSTFLAPCKGVLADGNLICTSYVLPIAMAAKEHSVPFVVLYWKWKLTEKFLKPGDSFTQLTSPADVGSLCEMASKTTAVLSPDGEIVPGNLVKIYINEDGPHGPADIFPLMQSIYHPSSTD